MVSKGFNIDPFRLFVPSTTSTCLCFDTYVEMFVPSIHASIYYIVWKGCRLQSFCKYERSDPDHLDTLALLLNFLDGDTLTRTPVTRCVHNQT